MYVNAIYKLVDLAWGEAGPLFGNCKDWAKETWSPTQPQHFRALEGLRASAYNKGDGQGQGWVVLDISMCVHCSPWLFACWWLTILYCSISDTYLADVHEDSANHQLASVFLPGNRPLPLPTTSTFLAFPWPEKRTCFTTHVKGFPRDRRSESITGLLPWKLSWKIKSQHSTCTHRRAVSPVSWIVFLPPPMFPESGYAVAGFDVPSIMNSTWGFAIHERVQQRLFHFMIMSVFVLTLFSCCSAFAALTFFWRSRSPHPM
jgi:hypothetical protein